MMLFFLAALHLSDLMTPAEQQKTGVSTLSTTQKTELEKWMNTTFVLKTQNSNQPLSLQQNTQGGAMLTFSDGSTYEIAPADRSKAMFWLTPINVKMEPGTDPNYPTKITNTLTNVSVNGKKSK